MSNGIGGGQETEQTKIEFLVDGKPTQEFLNVAKTLESLGAWIEKAVSSLDRFEKKVNNIGTAAKNINEKTKGYSSKSVSRLGKNKKTATELHNIPVDSRTSAGKEGLAILKSQQQLIDSQRDLTKALEESVRSSATANEVRARAMSQNAHTNAFEAPSRNESRNEWVRNMRQTEGTRLIRSNYERDYILSGRRRRDDDYRSEILGYRRSREQLMTSRQGMNPFSARNTFSSYTREFVGNETRSKDLFGVLPRIGALISGLKGDAGVFNKEGSLGMLPFSGVSRGGLKGSVFSLLTRAITDLAKAGLEAYGSLNKLETSLGVVFGSKAQAGMIFDEIKEYAVTSPFGVAQTAEMATLLKQSGIYDSDLMSTLKIIGDLAGGNEEKFRRIANNYAQTLAIGKVTTKDMREFANAGIPIFAATASHLGISRKELSSKIEEGEITAQVIENVFKELTSEGGLFYKATEQGAKTYAARAVNLEDTKQIALSEVGEYFYEHTPLVTGIMDFKEGFFELINETFDKANIKSAAQEMKEIKEDIKRTNELLDSGELSVHDEKIYEQQKENYENAYSISDELKVLNDLFMLRKDNLDQFQGDLSIAETEQRIAFLTKEIAELDELIDVLDGVESLDYRARRQMYQDELYSLNYSLLDQRNLQQKYASLYSSEEGIAHAMVISQQQWKASQAFFNKQAEYNQLSTTNMNDRLNEMFKQTELYKQQQKDEEIEFLYKALEVAQKGSDLASGINAFAGMSSTEIKDTIGTYFKAVEKDAFNGMTLSVNDIKNLTQSVGFAKNVDWGEDENAALESLFKKLNDPSSYGTEQKRKSLTQQVGQFVEEWTEKNSEMVTYAFSSLEFVGLDEEKINAVLEEYKKSEREAATPFWARLAGDIFGWDPGMLEWTNYRSDEGDHSYGLTAYKTGVFKDKTRVIPQRGGMFDKNGVAAILEASGSKYLDLLKFAYNADGSVLKQGPNDIEQYDWAKSFEALKDEAMSLESSVKVSEALASFYTTEREKFTNYLTSSVIKEEDWDKLTDEAYKKEFGYVGEEWEQLTNGLSMALEEFVDENGEVAYRIKSEGMRYALEIERLLKESEALTSQFSSLKGSIASLVESTEQINLKRFARTTNLFGDNLSGVQQENLADTAYSVMKEELAKMGLDESQRKEYLSQSTDFIQRALSGDLSSFNNEHEKALAKAIIEMVNATKTNTAALIGLNLSKVMPIVESDVSFDAMTFFRSGIVPMTNSLGETGKQQRILSSLGVTDYSYNQLVSALSHEENADILEQMESVTGLNATEDGIDKVLDKFSLLNEAAKQFDESMTNVANGALNAFYDFASSGIVNVFETIGKSLITSESASENLSSALKDMFKNLAGQISTLLVTEGLRTMGAGAVYGSTTGDWSKFYTGLGMVAAGGFGSILSGMMQADKEDDNADAEVQRLQTIKDMLADLLAQARVDAEYYEKNLRHQKAISANEAISSYTKVNDAIITPRGDVISTHPDDWLIATKTPHELGGSAAPVVTITIVNESGNAVKVARTEQQRNGNNIDIKAVVVAVMNEAVADGSLDSGLAMYQQRQQGKVVSY